MTRLWSNYVEKFSHAHLDWYSIGVLMKYNKDKVEDYLKNNVGHIVYR